MKGNKRIVALILAAVFVVSGALMLRQALDYRSATQSYNHAQELARLPQKTTELPDPLIPLAPPKVTASSTEAPTEPTEETEPMDMHAQYLSKLDIEALQQVNSDVLGWIYIPDTAVTYPLLHAGNNATYLSVAWDGTSNRAGSIFLEAKNQLDLQDFNTIIYGHHMRNGSMFADIVNYQDQTFRDEHPCVYITTGSTIRRYEVFSAYEAGITSDTYRLYFKDDAQKLSAIHHYLTSSVLAEGLTPTVDDYILTLSTCTGNGTYETRWVVQAILTGQWE